MTGKAELIVVILLSTIAYLGLAILGLGGIAAFFAQPSRSALAIATLALAGAALFSGGQLGSGMHEDLGQSLRHRTVHVHWSPCCLSSSLHGAPACFGSSGETPFWADVALFTIGGTLRIWPIFVLGDRFSGLVTIQPGHTLVTTGIYSVIRNPSYLVS
jgi:hypothetical protein